MPPSPFIPMPRGRRGLRVARLLTSGTLLLMCLSTVVGHSYRGQHGQRRVSTGRGMATAHRQMTDAVASMAETSVSEQRKAMAAAAERAGTCAAKMAANATLGAPGICTGEHDQSWLSEVNTCRCIPRETIVSLHNIETPGMVLPSMVAVRRCSGWCYVMGQSCMAIRTATKSITLRDSRFHQCSVVRVDEDAECDCMCPITAADCTEKQEFRADLCLCQCKKTAEYRRGCGAHRRWDDQQCQCVCQEHRHCSSGLGWSEDHCECLPMMMPDDSGNFANAYESENSVRY